MTGGGSAADSESGPTVVARLLAQPDAAAGLARSLAELFDASDAAVSAYEADGRWTVAIHFAVPPNETAVRALVALAAGAEAANALTFENLGARDWVGQSLAGLTPVHAGRFVVHGAHDRARIRTNRIGIEIEAALAFGTGHHGTTRGCLLALDALVKLQTKARRRLLRPRARRTGRLKVLDLGTGSGVLAIAAAKALRTPVLASDIDARAVQTARQNVKLNRAPGVRVIHAAGLGARRFRECAPFDLVLANILLGPLQRMARPMAQLLAPGARVVLSGLLAAQANAAIAAYRARGLALERRMTLDGWATLVLRRGRA